MPVLATQRGCIPDQLAGLNWTYPESTFVADACATINFWRAEPSQYSSASQNAGTRFEEQGSIDADALQNFIREISKG